MAPVYAFLEKNEKFIPLKAPLSVFTPLELEKYYGQSELYVSNFVDQLKPFVDAGEDVRKLFNLRIKHTVRTNKGVKELFTVPAAFELSDSALSIICPLWGQSKILEPFFLIFFADQLCGPLDEAMVSEAADRDQNLFELALMRSAFVVFYALHFGYVNSDYLSNLRYRALSETLSGTETKQGLTEADEIVLTAHLYITGKTGEKISLEQLTRNGKLGSKLLGRLEKIAGMTQASKIQPPDLYEKGGLCVAK